jgi:hypothetical protein
MRIDLNRGDAETRRGVDRGFDLRMILLSLRLSVSAVQFSFSK